MLIRYPNLIKDVNDVRCSDGGKNSNKPVRYSLKPVFLFLSRQLFLALFADSRFEQDGHLRSARRKLLDRPSRRFESLPRLAHRARFFEITLRLCSIQKIGKTSMDRFQNALKQIFL